MFCLTSMIGRELDHLIARSVECIVTVAVLSRLLAFELNKIPPASHFLRSASQFAGVA